MDGQPLISVIVPIYNVAPYLRKCLDSLRGQTLKDIEVICIDDGSTDESGRIADEYATDPRFRIIHTENRGLSAARNRGIDEARADWLMFVDSDDWVDKEFCRIPYEAAVENEADLVIFQWVDIKNGRTYRRHKKFTSGHIDEFAAYETGGMIAWNKLYRKHLFRTIRYPLGRVYEEIATTHKLVHLSNRIMTIQESLIFHVSREGSITHTHDANNNRDCFLAKLEQCDDMISYGYSKEKMQALRCSAAIEYLSRMALCNDEMCQRAKEIINSVESIPKVIPLKRKIAIFIWKNDERLFCLICRALGRIEPGNY